jgi:peptidoglycan hydrolase-like protein with peptidoglycan-binding domain
VQDLQRLLRELGFLTIRGDADGNIVNEPALTNAAQTAGIYQAGGTVTNAATTAAAIRPTTEQGVFGRSTEWAVKEFQIYASMSHVAQLNVERLRELTGEAAPDEAAWSVGQRGQVPAATTLPAGVTNHPVSFHVATLDQVENTARYTGPISGVVNADTRTALEHWRDNRYRCPVVIEAWRHTNLGVRTTLYQNKVNIWRHDEVDRTPRVFSRDFTQYYTYPDTHSQVDYQVLGTYLPYMTYGGPTSEVPNHTWSECEMMPDTLIGVTLDDLTANLEGATTSTYRVVRAAAEQENYGNYGSINANDDALISIGSCHWTMGLRPAAGMNEGELAGALAYFLSTDQDAYRVAFGDFGLYPSETWEARSATPPRGGDTNMYDDSQKKYTGWWREHTEAIQPGQAIASLDQLPFIPASYVEAVNYRSWHWFFRFTMACRTIRPLQRMMWDMPRIRLQDILETTLNVTQGTIHFTAPIGEIFTSEKALSVLVRWHIKFPTHVISQGNANRVVRAIRNAIQNNTGINWGLPLAQWGDNHETALTDSLVTEGNAANNTISTASEWPNYQNRGTRNYTLQNQLGALRTARNTFHLDSTGI